MNTRSFAGRAEVEARLLASLGHPVVATDVAFRITYWNASAAELLGFSAEEALGRDVIELASVELSQEAADEVVAGLLTGGASSRDFWVRRKDGVRLPVLASLTPLLDEAGEFTGLVATATDISQRKRAEEAMARLSAIVESSSDAIIGMDLDGRITSWNAAAERLYGYTAEERIGVNPSTEGSPDEVQETRTLLEGLAEGRVLESFESVRTRPDGSSVDVATSVYPVTGADGSVVGAAAISRDIGARKKLERLAAEEHRRLEEAQRLAEIGSFEWDVGLRRARWSPELRRILAVPDGSPDDYEYFLKEVHPDDRQALVDDVLAWLARPEQPFEREFRVVLAPGETRWLSTRAVIDRGPEGDQLLMVGSTQDVSRQREYETARRQAEQRFDVAFELGSVGMLIMDLDHRILRVNPALCRFFGRSESELVGRRADQFSHTGEVPGGEVPNVDLELRHARPDGKVVSALVHTATVRDAGGDPEYMFAQVVDITERKHVEEEMQRLAMHDPLTGLPNRYLLQDRLETAIARSARSHRRVAVLFIDADHFKVVNDSLGHTAGDALLVQLAHRLLRESRSGDTVARFGGDEFVMICEDVMDASEAEVIGARVARLLDEPFYIGDQQLYVTVSTGVVIPDEKATPTTVLRDADAAMYRAKEKGRARLEVFDETLRHRAARRLDLEVMLRHALDQEEFRLVFQPIVGLPAERPTAVEALVRWMHPERGLVPPTDFIPAAEETGLIVPLGAWVLDRALSQLAQWRKQVPGCGDLQLGVNLSPRQLLAGDLIARCSDAVAAYGLPPDCLCLEITEGTVMDDVDVSIPILRRVADLGIRVAVDDFGAGYSSLNYLKRLPVHTLKIDRSFVDGLGTDPDDSAIVRAIVSLGHALGLELCAEGVETDEQRRELVSLGCHRAQGYLFSPPIPPEHVSGWLVRQAAG